jgi:GDSL-like lipase/acylhydrolase family protein
LIDPVSGLAVFGLGAPVKRLTLFAKGNVDVHDSLHSCRIGGEVRWNGINDVVRGRADVLIRLRHETWTRSDAVLEATGAVPPEIAERQLPLGTYPAPSQFGTTLFDSKVDAIVLSVLGETATALVRHNRDGFLFYPADADKWSGSDRDWLKAGFTRTELLDVATSMNNFRQIIDRIRARSDVPILIYNVSSIIPGETVHCFQGLGEIYSTRCRRFNLGLADLSEETGVSIIDVDTIIGRAGADKLKLDAMHLTPEGYRLVAEEVVRVLGDLGVMPTIEEPTCAQA